MKCSNSNAPALKTLDTLLRSYARHAPHAPTPMPLAILNAAFGWHQHPRNGKVARLPEPTRNLINQMLQDGLTYRQLLDKLQLTVTLPYQLSEMNLSNWYRGGFQDWRRTKLEALAALPAAPGAAPALAHLLAGTTPPPSPNRAISRHISPYPAI